mgnify:CR=1 FL=1
MLSFSCPFSRKTVRVNLLVTFQTKRFGFTSGRFSIFSRLSDLWLLWVNILQDMEEIFIFFLDRMVFLAWVLGYASRSRSFCCLPHPSSDNSSWNLSCLPDICPFKVSKGGLHRCKFWQIVNKYFIKLTNCLIFIFSQFLAEEQMRARLVLQLEAGGSLCNLKYMKGPKYITQTQSNNLWYE